MTTLTTTKKRAPMTFNEATPVLPSTSSTGKVTSAAVAEHGRKKIGTSLPPDLYRQAKAHAALDDMTIQDVIETALREYVTRGK